MSNILKIGALTLLGSAGAFKVTVAVVLSGLVLSGHFYGVGGNVVGVWLEGYYTDIDLEQWGITAFDLPTPAFFSDVVVEWVIYDEKGDEVNRDSYYKQLLVKNEVFTIQKETVFRRRYDDLTVVTVVLKISGKVGYLPIPLSKEEKFTVDLHQVISKEIIIN